MANLIYPLVEQHTYGIKSKTTVTPPRLVSVIRDKAKPTAIVMTFDQPVVWSDSLRSEFLIDGKRGLVQHGASHKNTLRLELSTPTGSKLSYLDSETWSQQRLLRGSNGIAALTFAGVPIR